MTIYRASMGALYLEDMGIKRLLGKIATGVVACVCIGGCAKQADNSFTGFDNSLPDSSVGSNSSTGLGGSEAGIVTYPPPDISDASLVTITSLTGEGGSGV